MLSEGLGEEAEVVIVDRSDAFVFGYSKLDVMFGRVPPEEIRLPYADLVKPGVLFLRETVTAIEPESRRVTTDQGVHEGDVLVVALGADYDFEATPGLAEGENEFYSVAGAERLREILPSFSGGRALVGVCGARFVLRGVRGRPDRPGRRRLSLRPEANRLVSGAVTRARCREACVRLEPPRPLVRTLTLAPIRATTAFPLTIRMR
jgi:hypothetical protein